MILVDTSVMMWTSSLWIKPENRSWGAHPPRVLLDAPRVQPFGVRAFAGAREFLGAFPNSTPVFGRAPVKLVQCL